MAAWVSEEHSGEEREQQRQTEEFHLHPLRCLFGSSVAEISGRQLQTNQRPTIYSGASEHFNVHRRLI